LTYSDTDADQVTLGDCDPKDRSQDFLTGTSVNTKVRFNFPFPWHGPLGRQWLMYKPCGLIGAPHYFMLHCGLGCLSNSSPPVAPPLFFLLSTTCPHAIHSCNSEPLSIIAFMHTIV
jgi:hypothetical protein